MEMPARIKSIHSPTHIIEPVINGLDCRIVYKESHPKGSDFQIEIELESTPSTFGWIEKSIDFPDEVSFLVSFFPNRVLRKPAKYSKYEFIFLVDQSGSMEGAPISHAKTALQFFLQSLPLSCTFNIIGFGTSFVKYFQEMMPYDQKSLSMASRYVDSMDAVLGGTNILQPLKWIFSNRITSDAKRVIFVLTDGAVSNSEEVIREVKRQQNTQVFSLGVGPSASRELVRKKKKKKRIEKLVGISFFFFLA
jgi:uncharacterized protein YegL